MLFFRALLDVDRVRRSVHSLDIREDPQDGQALDGGARDSG